MDAAIALILVQDGLVNGAIYALLAISLVLVFAVTRVVLIPQGEFVAYGALSFALIENGRLPGSLGLLAALAVAGCLTGLWQEAAWRPGRWRVLGRLLATTLAVPAAVILVAVLVVPQRPGPAVAALLALAIVTPMGPLLYRIAFQKLADASVLVLLVAALGVHLALNGLGLLFFGPEGFRARGLVVPGPGLHLGGFALSAPQLAVLAAALVLMAALAAFLGATLHGSALRATAVNRVGARLVGISVAGSGRIAFTLAGAIGAGAGILIAPLSTIYYDSGFIIGLKGFVAAIIGGLASAPLAAAGALGVGLIESFSAFWASPFKEAIVFTAIIPVLLWRSLRAPPTEDEE